MKYVPLFLIAVLTLSCTQKVDKNEQIYNEFQLIIGNSWSNLLSEIDKHESVYAIETGDSINLTRQQLLLTNYNDSIINLGEGYYLPANTIVEVQDASYDLIKIKVSTTDSVGFLSEVIAKDNLSDGVYSLGFKNKIEEAKQLRTELINNLKLKHNLSDKEFDELIFKEHHIRTGEFMTRY